jgi:gamma-glutamyl:cysteine ligase YbdK (ATP-grasp superfamily)
MGQEIGRTRFEQRDFQRFDRQLRAETQALHDLIERGALSQHAPMVGLELEAWLIDAEGRPAPRNADFLATLGCDDVVTELGRFNIELNVPPRPAAGDGLRRLHDDLQALWGRCARTAADLGLRVVSIGILPTVRDADLTLANVSDRARYRALNTQVLRQRRGRPSRLDIDGPDGTSLHCEHGDVMLEAAATSFQVHLQVPADDAARTYNAALWASPFTVALAANSPLLFGRRLWHETRVPLFEQALNVGSRELGGGAVLSRVTFGSGYVGWSMAEVFRENLERFEPLLPVDPPGSPGSLPHLRLHNGTIWRWNRALLGFDEGDGTPHLRVEHRPMAAGPTIGDMMANLAFAVGLIAEAARDETPPEAVLPFADLRRRFYAAARDGLDASLEAWPAGQGTTLRDALLGGLIDKAGDGLSRLGVPTALSAAWLHGLEARVASGRTGSHWQLRHLERAGGDLAALTLAYAERQAEGAPVHLWG